MIDSFSVFLKISKKHKMYQLIDKEGNTTSEAVQFSFVFNK